MKTIATAIAALLALTAAAETHTVKFRRLNGTVFHQVEVEHGGSTSLPAAPVETHFRFKGWDHGDWLSCVTNDINVYALYENDGSKTWAAGTSFGSKSIAEREEPYSLDEYFKMYDSVAWADEFSRGSNTAVAVNGSYWNYDLDDRRKISLETSGGNQAESNGCLVLTIRREHAVRQGYGQNIEYDFTGGGIKSNNKVAFKHGRCEVRAKLTHNRGCGSSFWMLGNSGGYPACGELDIFEQPSGGDWITGGVHIPGRGKSSTISNGSPTSSEDGVHFGYGFHRYGTIVNDREILWYMDDHIFKRMDVRDERYDMFRNRSFYVILSFGLHTNNWVQAPDAPVDKYDLPELTDHVDFLVDYCRIYVNTNLNNTTPHVPPVPGAKLSRPVNATVWRGWDMAYGKPSSSAFVSNINSGYGVRYYIKTALSEYFARDGIDALAFLTEPDVKTDRNAAEFDIPGYTTMFISANANAWNNDDNDGSGNQGRLQLFGGLMFNTRRFSVSESGVGLMTLSDDPAFTNCYAICADLREKATGARVKVIAANVTTTNGVENAGGTVAQGFDTLFTKLNAMTNDNVIVFFQGMNLSLYNYIKAQADARLQTPYSFVNKVTTSPVYQCCYVTACASASAARPAKIPVTMESLAASYAHDPQALQAAVLFDELPEAADGYADIFDAADYAKALTVAFPGYSGSEDLKNFPVLVNLSTGIDGFSYADFAMKNCGDLRFTDASGNLLPHEIDTWDTNGVSTVWVKVPSLTSSTTITAHYGCAAPVRPVAAKVWDDDYVGVWHLGEEALPLRESSGVSVDFTRSSGETIGYAAQGVVGGAVDFANGPSNAVVAIDHDALDGFPWFTLEAWTRQDAHKTNAGILSKRQSYNRQCSYHMLDGGSSAVLYVGTNSTAAARWTSGAVRPEMGAWTHQAYSIDMTTASSNVRGYMNGAAQNPGSVNFAVSSLTNGIGNLTLGNLNANSKDNSFNGLIDEVRVSRCVRSADWIKATHDTIANAGFASCEIVVPPPAPPPVATDAEGYDWTNRLFTVSGLEPGATVTLTLTAGVASSPSEPGVVSAVQTADSTGSVSFSSATTAGALYTYAFLTNGVEFASGSFLAGAWDANGAWFSAAPDGNGGSTDVGGSWILPPEATNATAYVVGDATDFTLTEAASAAGTGNVVRAEIALRYDSLNDASDTFSDLSLGDTLAAVTAVTNSSAGGAAQWKACVGGTWIALDGDIVPAPDTDYHVRLEGDFAAATPRVRLSVSADGGASYAVLSSAAIGDEWLVPNNAAATALTGIATDGAARVAALRGQLSNAWVAETGGVRYASLAEALRAAGRGGTVTLLTSASAPASLAAGRTIVGNGHIFVTYNDWRGTLFFMQ